MARFLGAIEGSRGEATRLGTPSSGIRAQAQGWNVGVKVYGRDDNGEDEFLVYATGGSTDTSGRLLGIVRLVDGTPTFTPEPYVAPGDFQRQARDYA